MFRRFLDATDYWFGYSDDSSAGSYDLARECFVVLANDQTNAANTAEVGDGEVPPPARELDRNRVQGQALLPPHARAGDSPHLQQDTAFLPRLCTSGSLVKSKLSTPDLPKSRKRVAEQRGKRNKDSVSIYKILQTNSCSLHGHKAQMLTSKQKRARRPVVLRLGGRRHQGHRGTKCP
jgi:hypothetical protein